MSFPDSLHDQLKPADTIVPLWDLQDTDDTVPSPERLEYANPGELTVETDKRVLVDRQHFLPGGKYRSIVKLFLKYESQSKQDKWLIATGWLLRPDLVATAGHCAYDWHHSLGRLAQVKCYIGYYGLESIQDPDAQVQFRQGKRVATTLEWLATRSNGGFNVSFIQLEHAFVGVEPFRVIEAPLSGHLMTGIAGYPSDVKDPRTKEPAAHMYEVFLPTSLDLVGSQLRTPKYQLGHFTSFSGSPVLRGEGHGAVGVHVYGSTPNCASVIGMHGTHFQNYIAAFDPRARSVHLPAVPSMSRIQYIAIPTTSTRHAMTGKEGSSSAAKDFAINR